MNKHLISSSDVDNDLAIIKQFIKINNSKNKRYKERIKVLSEYIEKLKICNLTWEACGQIYNCMVHQNNEDKVRIIYELYIFVLENRKISESEKKVLINKERLFNYIYRPFTFKCETLNDNKNMRYIERIEYIGGIKDYALREVFYYFLKGLNNYDSASVKPKVHKLSIYLVNKKINDISWIPTNYNTSSLSLILYTDFVYSLIEQNVYKGDYKQELIDNKQEYVDYIMKDTPKELLFKNNYTVSPKSIFSTSSDFCSKTYFVINSQNLFIINLLKEFAYWLSNENKIKDNRYQLFVNNFIESVDNSIINITDFSENLYIKQLVYYYNWEKQLGTCCNTFYIWLLSKKSININWNNFGVLGIDMIKSRTTILGLVNGYKPINYSIYDEVPIYDKLLLAENGMDNKINVNKDKGYLVDFTQVTNNTLRNCIKTYYWKYCSYGFSTRYKKILFIIRWLGYLSNEYKDSKCIKITLGQILEEKNRIVSMNTCDSTKSTNILAIKLFLKSILEDSYNFNREEYIDVDEVAINLLKHKDSKGNPYTDCYTNSEIKQIISELNSNYRGDVLSLKYLIASCAVKILSRSELRMESILNIEINNIKNESGNFIVSVGSKISGNGLQEYAITNKVFNIMSDCIRLTYDIRIKATEQLKDKLFIYSPRKGIVSQMSSDTVLQMVKKACLSKGITYKGNHAIRNFYQKNVTMKYEMMGGENSSVLTALSGHSKNIHYKYYNKIDYDELARKLYYVEIGNTQIKGLIQEVKIQDTKGVVELGCGSCLEDYCKDESGLTCLLCTSFVAWTNNIPAFEAKVNEIEKQIIKVEEYHEKELLNIIKALHVKYLMELYKRREESQIEK